MLLTANTRQTLRVLTAGLLYLGCAGPSHPGDPGNVTAGVQVQAGREFDISVGQEVQIQGTGLTVRFNGVSDDSRCPADVQCVWAGNAVVRLSLSSPGAGGIDLSLNTTLEPRSGSFGSHVVRLTGLKPAPRSGTSIPATSYVATLEARALNSGP